MKVVINGCGIAGRTLAYWWTLFLSRDEYLPIPPPLTEPERKAVLRRIFGDVGWEAPQILSALEHADDVYFEDVSQIRFSGRENRLRR